MRVITAILQLAISVGDYLFSFLYASVTIKVGLLRTKGKNLRAAKLPPLTNTKTKLDLTNLKRGFSQTPS